MDMGGSLSGAGLQRALPNPHSSSKYTAAYHSDECSTRTHRLPDTNPNPCAQRDAHAIFVGGALPASGAFAVHPAG